jgi:16S rRNA (guanine527-N7)-methyltransferase
VGEVVSVLTPECISQEASILGFILSQKQAESLAFFGRLLIKWNRVYNLTSISSEEDVLRLHILDSLSFVAAVKNKELQNVLDVGSGGGLPAIPFAILRPATKVTMIDAVQKKAVFLQQAILQLGLNNAKVVHSRIEDFKEENFDAVTCRAFATIGKTISLTKRFLIPEGRWLLMKGKMPEEELSELSEDVKVVEIRKLTVPGLVSERCLIEIEQYK